MQGNYFITIGYSRFKDRAGETHGWVMFGRGCTSVEQKIEACIVMLNILGFEAPAEITPAPGGKPVQITLISRAPMRVAGPVGKPVAKPATGGSAKGRSQPHCSPPKQLSPPLVAAAGPGQAQPAAGGLAPAVAAPAPAPGAVQPATGGPAPAAVAPAQVPQVSVAAPVPVYPKAQPGPVPPRPGYPKKAQSVPPRPGYPKAPASGGTWPTWAEILAEQARKAKEEEDAAAEAEEASGVHEERPKWTEEEMRAWREAVAAVKRVTGRIVHRVTATGVYDPRGPPRALSIQEQWLMADVIRAVADWNGHDSAILLATGGEGVKKFTDKQLGHQLWLCGSDVMGRQRPPMAAEALLKATPPDPSTGGWPLAADAPKSVQIRFIKDLCQRHRGEVREIKGEWVDIDSPFPKPASGGDRFFHPQCCINAESQRALTTFVKGGKAIGKAVDGKQQTLQKKGGDLWMKELANTFIQPASGGHPTKHILRQARVFALPELFAQFGDVYTAETLYEYYLAARIIVHKRMHGRSAQVRQAAAQERVQQTGRYGFGRRRW